VRGIANVLFDNAGQLLQWDTEGYSRYRYLVPIWLLWQLHTRRSSVYGITLQKLWSGAKILPRRLFHWLYIPWIHGLERKLCIETKQNTIFSTFSIF